jgi:hypothetical protein
MRPSNSTAPFGSSHALSKASRLLRDLSMLSCETLMKTVAEVKWMIRSRP